MYPLLRKAAQENYAKQEICQDKFKNNFYGVNYINSRDTTLLREGVTVGALSPVNRKELCQGWLRREKAENTTYHT